MLAEEKEHEKRSVQDEITALKVGLAQRQEKKDGLSKALNKLDADLRETQEQIKHRIQESQSYQQKKREAEDEIKHLELLVSELKTRQVALKGIQKKAWGRLLLFGCHWQWGIVCLRQVVFPEAKSVTIENCFDLACLTRSKQFYRITGLVVSRSGLFHC